MNSKNLLTTFTVIGWIVFAFSTPAIIMGAFFVLGTVQPWGLIVPLLVLTFGWILTRLNFQEIYWRRTLGVVIVVWGFFGLLTTLLIITRTESLTLTCGALPPIYLIGIGGLVLTLFSSKRKTASPVESLS